MGQSLRERSFRGRIRDGKLPKDVGRAVAGYLRLFDGKEASVTIKEWKKPRSLKQQAFYWAVVVPEVVAMFREFGTAIDEDDAHDYLQRRVVKWTKAIAGPDGEPIVVRRSSTEKTAAEWEADNEIIRAWAAGWGWVIKRPNEELEMLY